MAFMNPCHPSGLHNVATRKTKPRARILGVPLKRVREDQVVVHIRRSGSGYAWERDGVALGAHVSRLDSKREAALDAVRVLTRRGYDPSRVTIRGGRGIRSSGAYWHGVLKGERS